MKDLITALKLFLVLSFLTGIIYPVMITLYAQQFTSYKANGSLIEKNGVLVGSELIGQKFAQEKYFWSRPSVIDYNSLSSGATNLGPSSQELVKKYQERKVFLTTAHTLKTDDSMLLINPVPQDLLFASGSGLDPHITPDAAMFQVKRVALSRKIDSKKLSELVKRFIEDRQFGILGEPRVNVVLLNLALDQEPKSIE